MITCPWCGTSYGAFQSNCQRCGGPIPPPPKEPPRAQLLVYEPEPPPPAPRPISDNYVWKLLFSDGWAIAALIFLLLGGIFTLTGIPLVIGIVTAFVGIPFTILGFLFLVAGGFIFFKRLEYARTIVTVLREGQAVLGRITTVDVNANVQVNGRNPWTITYGFEATGSNHEGRVTTLSQPGWHLQPGNACYVLFLPDHPEKNALYPHP